MNTSDLLPADEEQRATVSSKASVIARKPAQTRCRGTHAKILNGISTMIAVMTKIGHEYILEAFSRASKS